MSINIIGYKVIDLHTCAIVKTYKENQKKLARAYADKKDFQHGDVRYFVREIIGE